MPTALDPRLADEQFLRLAALRRKKRLAAQARQPETPRDPHAELAANLARLNHQLQVKQGLFVTSPADIAIFGGAAFAGKLQPNESPVLTPKGWRALGDLKIGDSVSDPTTGGSVRVVQVFPQGQQRIYRLTFSDGSATECGDDHLWAFSLSRHTHQVPRSKRAVQRLFAWETLGAHAIESRWNSLRVDTTAAIRALFQKGDSVRIPLTEPILFTKNGHCGAIPGYLIGLMLGDAHLRTMEITSCDDEIREYLVKQDFVPLPVLHTDGKPKAYRPTGEMKKRLAEWLNNHGLRQCLSPQKWIPEFVFTADVAYRLEVLQGLMDSDGYVNSDGMCDFTSTSEKLAVGVQRLIWTLGGTAVIRSKMPHFSYRGERRDGLKAYMVAVNLGHKSAMFRLSRKRARCYDRSPEDSTLMRTLASVEDLGEKESRCMVVGSPYGLYMTDDYIVTHNSWALLIEPLKHISVGQFGAVCFRRTYNRITVEGGMWDESQMLYRPLGARPTSGNLTWAFPSGAAISFAHLQFEDDKFAWYGAQVPLLLWDQLEEFSESQFFFLLGRNRSTCGVKPYVRATCNPNPDSWLATFLDWWIDPDTGDPIPERAGVLRWFVRMPDDSFAWGDSAETLREEYGEAIGKSCRSVTFIPGTMDDNPIGMTLDPTYEANLMVQVGYLRKRLRFGNWKARPTSGDFFRRHWFPIVDAAPVELVKVVRYWDRAATEPNPENRDPDWTSGCKLGKGRDGLFYMLDYRRERLNPTDVEKLLKATAAEDGSHVEIALEQDPGQAGKMEAGYLARQLAGYRVKLYQKRQDKVTAAGPLASQAEAGNVRMVRGPWNKAVLDQFENFPGKGHDDDVDSGSGALGVLSGVLQGKIADGTGDYNIRRL